MADHDCVARINAQIADKNTQIAMAISFGSPGRELIQIATHKVRQSVRGRPVSFFASFCPFCGKSLAVEAEGGAL